MGDHLEKGFKKGRFPKSMPKKTQQSEMEGPTVHKVVKRYLGTHWDSYKVGHGSASH